MKNNIDISKKFVTEKNWIGGQLRESQTTKYLNKYCPYNGELLSRCPLSTADDVNHAVQSAKAAFSSWKKNRGFPFETREQIIYRLKHLINEHIDELSNLISIESGKTLMESNAEILNAIDFVEFAASFSNKTTAFQRVSDQIDCYSNRVPLGVVAAVTPFNFPIMLPLWIITSAVTLGNTLILKPSEQVPFSIIRLAELLQKAGLPEGVFNVVNGTAEVVEAFCDHPGIEAIGFIGSTQVAEKVYQRASSYNKRVLALGGSKNYAILLPDADEKNTVREIMNSTMECAGQRCMAVSVLVTVGNCDRYIRQMVKYARKFKPGTGFGAIINNQNLSKIKKYVNEAEQQGAKIILDGRNAVPKNQNIKGIENGYWFGPTIIDHVTPQMPVLQVESLSPVLLIVHVDTLEEAVALENQCPYGNTASVFTMSGKSAKYVTDGVRSGMCGVNVGMPFPKGVFGFGGWEKSRFGVGDITGDAVIQFWTKEKKITAKW